MNSVTWISLSFLARFILFFSAISTSATVINDVEFSVPTCGQGTLGFVGDMSINGTFILSSSDITIFSISVDGLTYSCNETTCMSKYPLKNRGI